MSTHSTALTWSTCRPGTERRERRDPRQGRCGLCQPCVDPVPHGVRGRGQSWPDKAQVSSPATCWSEGGERGVHMCAGPGTPEILPTGKEVLIGVLGSVLTTVLLVPLGERNNGSERESGNPSLHLQMSLGQNSTQSWRKSHLGAAKRKHLSSRFPLHQPSGWMLRPDSVGPGSLTGWREDLKSVFPSSPDNHLSKGEGAHLSLLLTPY